MFTNFLGGISPAGAALSLGSTIFGAIKGAKANQDNNAMLRQQQDQATADYGINYSQDFLKTNLARDVIRQARDQMNQSQRQVAGRAAITGASDEAIVAGNSEAQKNFNNTLSSVASMGVNYQLGQDRMYRANQEAIQGRRMAFNQMKAESAANMVENAGDLFGTLAFSNALRGEDLSDAGMGETAQKTRPTFGRNYDPMNFFSAVHHSLGRDARNQAPVSNAPGGDTLSGMYSPPTGGMLYDGQQEQFPR